MFLLISYQFLDNVDWVKLPQVGLVFLSRQCVYRLLWLLGLLYIRSDCRLAKKTLKHSNVNHDVYSIINTPATFNFMDPYQSSLIIAVWDTSKRLQATQQEIMDYSLMNGF